MSEKKVSLITLTYNQLEKATKPYIESLYENTDENLFELIIVDNASTDGTVEYLKGLEKTKNNVKVIYNDENLGYSKGNNQGIKAASGEYIGLLNNDIYLEENWLEKLTEFADKTDNIGLLSPYVITPYQCKTEQFTKKGYRIKNKNEYEKVIDALFCCVIFKKTLADEIGLLDENFSPAWYEDNDYSWRMIKSGKQNYILNEVNIYHNFSKTSHKLQKASEIQRRNKEYFCKKHGFIAEHYLEIALRNSLLEKEINTLKKSPFWILLSAQLKIEERFEKIFRGLIRKLR